MKAFQKLGFYLLLLISSFALSCCKDECEGQLPTSAEFEIYETLGWERKGTIVPNGDTAVATTITFVASDSSSDVTSYEWRVGSDERTFSERQFSLDFYKAAGSTIDISLVVKKNVNKMCFPEDDGIDTVFKNFYVSQTSLMGGKFEGFCQSNPSEKFVIHIGRTDKSDNNFTLDNLPNGCTRTFVDAHLFDLSTNYRKITFGLPNFKTDGQLNDLKCQIPWGKGTIQKDGVTLVLDYQIWEPFKRQFVSDQFIGIKKK